ncbi:hypothetical protein ES708_20459 [subsurface metagenome]
MASFLFVGCIPIIPDPDDPVDPDGPGLYLTGIVVDPKEVDLDLFIGEFVDIKEGDVSVTATYEIRGGDVDIALEDCLFLTSNSTVATVKKAVVGEDTTVTVTAVGAGTANIVVNYEDKFDTLEVTVTSRGSMEIIVDTPILLTTVLTEILPIPEGEVAGYSEYVGTSEVFTIKIVANDDVGKMVRPYLILSEEDEGLMDIKFWVGTDVAPPTGWANVFTIGEDGIINQFPPDNLEDFTGIWQVTIDKPGNYSAKIEYKTSPGGVTLCTKVITAVVFPVLPPPGF